MDTECNAYCTPVLHLYSACVCVWEGGVCVVWCGHWWLSGLYSGLLIENFCFAFVWCERVIVKDLHGLDLLTMLTKISVLIITLFSLPSSLLSFLSSSCLPYLPPLPSFLPSPSLLPPLPSFLPPLLPPLPSPPSSPPHLLPLPSFPHYSWTTLMTLQQTSSMQFPLTSSHLHHRGSEWQRPTSTR